jgi:hypothetical protein
MDKAAAFSFFEWVGECVKLMGGTLPQGEYLLPDKDPSWFWCYDDGMKPEDAVAEYREKNPGMLPWKTPIPN